jgi:hypothetical protein
MLAAAAQKGVAKGRGGNGHKRLVGGPHFADFVTVEVAARTLLRASLVFRRLTIPLRRLAVLARRLRKPQHRH